MLIKGTGVLKSILIRNAESCSSCREAEAQRWLEVSCDSAGWSMAELEAQKAKGVSVQSLHTKWWITFSRHFLRAARTALHGLTAHIGTVEKLVPPVNAESETASRWSVHPGWESETFRQERGEICSPLKRFVFFPGSWGPNWSLQKDGMFSMTEGISWLSPGASEHCVHCRNAV